MQYPGATPMPVFSGAGALTSQLTPVSLEQRKQQLVNQMVTGGQPHSAIGGSGMPFAPGLGQNAYLASFFGGYGNDPEGSFYGQHGVPSGGMMGHDPTAPPTPSQDPQSPSSQGTQGNGSSSQQASGIGPAGGFTGSGFEQPLNVFTGMTGMLGGYDPFSGIGSSYRPSILNIQAARLARMGAM